MHPKLSVRCASHLLPPALLRAFGLGAVLLANAAVARTSAATLDLDASEAPRGIERDAANPDWLTAIETPRSP
ncbi:MAG TPA: hypothetical protein VKG05_00955 [Steroidobacteraceae bacterium]|nr:hypothetical protein [Steroidobacteraceae bacterium]